MVTAQAAAAGDLVEIEDRGVGMTEEALAIANDRMAYAGLVSIQRPVNPDAYPNRALLERVLAGLRAI